MADKHSIEVLGVVRKALNERVRQWREEKASIDRRISNLCDLQAQSDDLAAKIAEAESRMETEQEEVAAVERRLGARNV